LNKNPAQRGPKLRGPKLRGPKLRGSTFLLSGGLGRRPSLHTFTDYLCRLLSPPGDRRAPIPQR
jgi:hypothetical protein